MATVYIPSLMQGLTGGEQEVEVEGSTVRRIVENLEKAYPGMKERLVENNRIKSNISVAIDGEVTPLGMLEKVGENSEVHFLPAIGGGG
jgi:molybdopterin synthase sulfur carrier subunit